MHKIFFLIVIIFLSGESLGQRFLALEKEYLMDDTFSIQVTDLKPKQAFIIRASMLDSSNRTWHSFAGFYADKNGTANLAKFPALNGTYTGVNSMGLIQSMNLPGTEYNRNRYLYNTEGTIPLKLKLEVDGKIFDSITINRSFTKSGIKIIKVRNEGLVGALYYPADKKSLHPIIVVGGSEGGLSGERSLQHYLIMAMLP